VKRLTIVFAVLAFAGCASDAKPATSASSGAPTSFSTNVCAAISHWQNAMVDAANAFSTDSPPLDIPARRARYLRAFDDQQAITADLVTALQSAPASGAPDEAVRTALLHAADDVRATLRDNQATAAAHPDSDYEFAGVKEDLLFAGTEKTLSEMLKPLDEQARENDPAVGGTCGRT
jgi:hypothetical protein